MRLFLTLLTVFGIFGLMMFVWLARAETAGGRFTFRNVAGPLIFTLSVVLGTVVIMFVSIFKG